MWRCLGPSFAVISALSQWGMEELPAGNRYTVGTSTGAESIPTAGLTQLVKAVTRPCLQSISRVPLEKAGLQHQAALGWAGCRVLATNSNPFSIPFIDRPEGGEPSKLATKLLSKPSGDSSTSS